MNKKQAGYATLIVVIFMLALPTIYMLQRPMVSHQIFPEEGTYVHPNSNLRQNIPLPVNEIVLFISVALVFVCFIGYQVWREIHEDSNC